MNSIKNISWIIGYTTDEHLLLDLDNTSLNKVQHLVRIIMQSYPETGDAIIMLSSTRRINQNIYYSPKEGIKIHTTRNNYHVIFDNYVSYERICHIVEALADLDILEKEYVKIRQFRGDMTLRVSSSPMMKGVKSAPVFLTAILNDRATKSDGYISRYLLVYRSLNPLLFSLTQ